jgi:hypothetical protein
MAKQYASQTAQNTASTQTYSPSDYAKALIERGVQPITAKELANYQSPYQQQVIDATMAQLEQQYGKQQSALTGNAIAQGALGGDRAAIAQAALMGEQGRNTASTMASLQQQGYTQALQAAQADQARVLQAAGMSGGTTTGASQMAGQTAGTEIGQTSGSSASNQRGTSHTTGYSTSDTRSDPTIFGGNLGFHADGGKVIHRNDGGGIPAWAAPPPMQTVVPMQMITAPSGSNKTMSTKDMFKLGNTARTQLGKLFETDRTGAGYSQNMASAGPGDSISVGVGDAAGPSSTAAAGDFAGAGAAGTAETGAVASDAGLTAVDAGAAGADAAAGVGAGASTAAGAGAGAAEAAGAAGKGAAGAGEAGSSMMALLALLADGGEVKKRADGGPLSSTPGISMKEGIGQEWFKVPTIDPTAGIKGSGSANGGEIKHRDAGGGVATQPTMAMPQLPANTLSRPMPALPTARAEMPQFNDPKTSNGKGSMGTSNGKGSHPQSPVNSNVSYPSSYTYPNVAGQTYSPTSASVQPYNYQNVSTPQLGYNTQPTQTSYGKGSGNAMANGGHVRHRWDGGEALDEFGNPVDPSVVKNEVPLSEREPGAWSSEAASGEPSKHISGRIPSPLEGWMTKEPAPESFSEPSAGIGGLQPGVSRISVSEPDRLLRPGEDPSSLANYKNSSFETNVEPVPIYMKSTVPVDIETGKDLSGGLSPIPKPTDASTAEPGAEAISPEKDTGEINHALTVAKELRASGMSENAIRGVLANVQDESGFNPDLRHPDQPRFTGEAHYAHGLFQMGGEEWNKYDEWLKSDHKGADWRDPTLQTQFMAQNLRENYPKLWDKMNKAGSAEEAAQMFLHEYENPAKRYAAARHEKYGNGVLRIDDYTSAPSKVSRRDEGETAPKVGLSPIPSSVSGREAETTTASTTYPSASTPQGEQEGNILTRIINAGFNPLKMSDRDLSFIAQTALGGMGGINKAADTAQGARAQDIQSQQHAVQMAMEAQKLQQSMAQPVVTGEFYDKNTGTWHKQYSTLNPKTGKYEENVSPKGSGATGASGQAEIADIAPDKSGDAFISEAKKSGYSSAILSTAQRVADYKADITKISGIKGEQRAIIDRLASRINPNYESAKYAAAADTEKKLGSGDVAKSIRSVGRLVDEGTQAHDLAGRTGNTRFESLNQAAGAIYPSGSQYGMSRTNLGTSLNNFYDSASAVAKGGGQSAEGDVKRRAASMNPNMAPEALQGSIKTELEVGLQNGQSNLSSYNSAHGYTPDNPKYKSIFDTLTPSQQQKVTRILGPDKIEEITGKPIKTSDNVRPIGVSRVQQAREATAPQMVPIGPNMSVPSDKIELLLKNPDKAQDFDIKFGRGASQRVFSLMKQRAQANG